jgi:hypothetical protein
MSQSYLLSLKKGEKDDADESALPSSSTLLSDLKVLSSEMDLVEIRLIQ